MPRPHKCRRIGSHMPATVFKPAGIPGIEADEIKLRLDEVESLRLGDLEGLYHDEAARRMGISRATFGRIVESARHKVADALINGKMLVFQGGVVMVSDSGTRTFMCSGCGQRFEAARGTGRPGKCPACGSLDFHRVHDEGGGGRGRCRRSRHGGGGGGGRGGRRGGPRGAGRSESGQMVAKQEETSE